MAENARRQTMARWAMPRDQKVDYVVRAALGRSEMREALATGLTDRILRIVRNHWWISAAMGEI